MYMVDSSESLTHVLCLFFLRLQMDRQLSTCVAVTLILIVSQCYSLPPDFFRIGSVYFSLNHLAVKVNKICLDR